MRKVEIEFSSDEKAEAFLKWMCNSGEQDYWQALEDADQPMEDGFDYDFNNLTMKGRG